MCVWICGPGKRGKEIINIVFTARNIDMLRVVVWNRPGKVETISLAMIVFDMSISFHHDVKLL